MVILSFIPRKFRKHVLSTDSDTARNQKKEFGITSVRKEIDTLKEKAAIQASKMEEIERKALELVSTEEDVRIQHILTDLFRQEARREDNKSLHLWDEKKKWLKDSPSKEKVEEYLLKTTIVQPTRERSTQTQTKNERKPSFADVVKTTADKETVSRTNYERSHSIDRRNNFKKKYSNPQQKPSQPKPHGTNDSPTSIIYNGTRYSKTNQTNNRGNIRGREVFSKSDHYGTSHKSNYRTNSFPHKSRQNLKRRNFLEEDGDLNHRYQKNQKQRWNQR